MTDFRAEYENTEPYDQIDVRGGGGGECVHVTTRRVLTGPLADAVRRRVGACDKAQVHITDVELCACYSSCTRDATYEMTLECHGVTKHFGSDYAIEWHTTSNCLSQLLAWLDEKP